MNLKKISAILMMGLFLPTQITSLEAAHAKKKHLKKKKKHVMRKKYTRPLPVVKDKSFMCNEQMCTIPQPYVEPQTCVLPTPQVEPPKVEPVPLAIKPMEENKKNDPCEEDEHLGIYFGCNVGPSQMGGTYQLSVGNSSIDQSGISNLTYDGDVFLGYLRKAEDYGIGIQFYYDPFSFTIKDSYSLNGAKQNYSIKFSDAFGGCILLGYYPHRHTFFYARGGMELQKISLALTDTATPSAAFDTGFGNYKQAITIGAGARYTMGNIVFGCEYVYRNYPKITATGNSIVTPQATSLRISAAYLF
jgi:hypothetical protein